MASPKVIAAAQAAASWARARRATWTTVPLPRPVTPATATPIVQPYVAVLESEPAEVETVIFPTAAPPPAPPPPPPAPERRTISPWVMRGAIAAGILIPIGLAGAYVMRGGPATLRDNAGTRPAPAPATSAPKAASPSKSTGVLKVTSTPDGARVVVDGRDRGVTPLSINDIAVGAHIVSIEAKTGSVERSVMVTADNIAQLDEQIFDGWVAIFSPVELVISENGKVLRPDDHNEIMLPPGTHRLRFTNTKLAYDETKSIVIKPGERNAYTVTPPRSTVSVSVSGGEPAEVFLDGAKLGDTPVNAAPAAIGTHDLLVKRASGAQKRIAITVTVKPFAVTVDF